IAVLEAAAPGPDPLARARRLLARLDRTPPDRAGAPPFSGGLAGFLGYDLGGNFEPRMRVGPSTAAPAPDDAPPPGDAPDEPALPPLRLGLYDWSIAWDRRTGAAYLGGRTFDGDQDRLGRRLAGVLDRLTVAPNALSRAGTAGCGSSEDLVFDTSLDRPSYEAGVRAIRASIARGEIYQANLARRLSTAFRGDPWSIYRILRTGDPALFAGYIDLGQKRAIISASPEAFLSIDADRVVSTDPIKGTRPRGDTPEDDRALAGELLGSAKDRAENVMIVDVLRNDLGRVCVPGSVRVPRLCRLERTSAVQHLVSTVTGRLAPGRDAFDLLAAAFPGGSITGAPKIRAIAVIETLEPVRRGPYTGCALWLGPDGQLGSSILIRTFVADGRRLSLHVGGGITWRSDPAAEWAETVAKARGPLRAIGGREAVS
ncbi:MAG: anthranilate synthase component I family protein, partial [Candidatus Limnocylindrales bacterium]